MIKFIHCNTRQEFYNAAGYNWYKVIKVESGQTGFEFVTDYNTWKKQK